MFEIDVPHRDESLYLEELQMLEDWIEEFYPKTQYISRCYTECNSFIFYDAKVAAHFKLTWA